MLRQHMQAVIPLEKLRDFIGYARSRCQPELSDEAAQDLVQAYQTMRNQGVGRNTITATPRQLESMVRLSEALARMRLSSTVERYDVAEAVRLMKVSASFQRFIYSTFGILGLIMLTWVQTLLQLTHGVQLCSGYTDSTITSTVLLCWQPLGTSFWLVSVPTVQQLSLYLRCIQ